MLAPFEKQNVPGATGNCPLQFLIKLDFNQNYIFFTKLQNHFIIKQLKPTKYLPNNFSYNYKNIFVLHGAVLL